MISLIKLILVSELKNIEKMTAREIRYSMTIYNKMFRIKKNKKQQLAL